MSVLIRNGRIVTAADDYVADLYIEDETITPDRRVARHAGRQGDRRGGQVRAAGLRRSAHASRHAVRRDGDDRRRRIRADFRSVRRHHVPRRLRHPAPGAHVRTGPRGVARKGERQAGDRHGLPHGGHRSRERRDARGARLAARPGHYVVQALHGLQGRADGRRRDALPHDGGRGEDGCARDGARRERRRDRRSREAGARGRSHGAALPRAHTPA